MVFHIHFYNYFVCGEKIVIDFTDLGEYCYETRINGDHC